MSQLLRSILTMLLSVALLAGLGLPAATADASTPTGRQAQGQPGNPPLASSGVADATSNIEKVDRQAAPALIVLGALAKFGITHVIKWYGKTQLKKAAKSYLLNSVRTDKWTHIMAPKHKWSSVGARSKEQVAELMSRAMAEGKHIPYGTNAKMARWTHRGQTIEVTYAKNGGQISNGWVK
jgi:hypothetical protein